MKKMIFLLPIFVIFFLYSCEKQPVTTVTTVTTKTTLTEPGTNGFLISQEIVVRGNTVWGFSRESYGTGMQWRDIVAQNPFLQQPGRVYYNKDRKMWIVKIHVGEVVKIGDNIITPSCVVEETTTTITKTTPAPEFVFPWWGWLLIAFFAVGFLCLIFRHSTNNSSSASVVIDLRSGLGIDLATKSALLGRDQDRKDKLIKIIQDGSEKDAISHFNVSLDHEYMDVSVDYKDNGKKDPKTEGEK